MDRLPVFYLTVVAFEEAEALIHLSEMIEWVGIRKKNVWRMEQLVPRLRRILECTVILPVGDGFREFKFADRYVLDERAGVLFIQFSEAFRLEAHRAAVLPYKEYRALSRKMFVLEVYSKLLLILQEGAYAETWDVRREMRPLKERFNFRARLEVALTEIRKVRPKLPFFRGPKRGVACKLSEFRKYSHGVDVAEEQRKFAAAIEGMSRHEVHAYILSRPENERERLFSDYLDDWMRPEVERQIERTAAVKEQGMAAVRGLNARTMALREIAEHDQEAVAVAEAEVAEAEATEAVETAAGVTTLVATESDIEQVGQASVGEDDAAVDGESEVHIMIDGPGSGAMPTEAGGDLAEPVGAGWRDTEDARGITESMTDEERARSRLRQIGALTGKAVGRLTGVHRMMGGLESATQGAQRLAGLVRTTAARMPVAWLVMRRDAGGQESAVATPTDGPETARASPGPLWQAITRWRQKSDGEHGPSG